MADFEDNASKHEVKSNGIFQDPELDSDQGVGRPRSNSIDEIFRQESTTLYEKKCLLVNREIDRMGMGRYQWCIWTLCGFGYFLDLLWAQAFGLVLQPLQQEFGFGCKNELHYIHYPACLQVQQLDKVATLEQASVLD